MNNKILFILLFNFFVFYIAKSQHYVLNNEKNDTTDVFFNKFPDVFYDSMHFDLLTFKCNQRVLTNYITNQKYIVSAYNYATFFKGQIAFLDSTSFKILSDSTIPENSKLQYCNKLAEGATKIHDSSRPLINYIFPGFGRSDSLYSVINRDFPNLKIFNQQYAIIRLDTTYFLWGNKSAFIDAIYSMQLIKDKSKIKKPNLSKYQYDTILTNKFIEHILAHNPKYDYSDAYSWDLLMHCNVFNINESDLNQIIPIYSTEEDLICIIPVNIKLDTMHFFDLISFYQDMDSLNNYFISKKVWDSIQKDSSYFYSFENITKDTTIKNVWYYFFRNNQCFDNQIIEELQQNRILKKNELAISSILPNKQIRYILRIRKDSEILPEAITYKLLYYQLKKQSPENPKKSKKESRKLPSF